MASINRTTIFAATALALACTPLASTAAKPTKSIAANAPPVMGCPALATAANPHFLDMDISTGVPKGIVWTASNPTGGKFSPVPITPLASGWAANPPGAKWIGPSSPASQTAAAGVYSYRTEFRLKPCSLAKYCTVSFAGSVAADDTGSASFVGPVFSVSATVNPANLVSLSQTKTMVNPNQMVLVNVNNGKVSATGFVLQGKLRRQCF